MWIQELDIKNFGKFYKNKIMLKPGINLIYGENESGKSTMHAFVRGCFYGVKKMRGRAAKMDTYNRYQPWDQSAYFAGSMRFVCGGKVFRLERDFTKGLAAGELVCETDGERLSLENGDLEMLLGNVSEVVFDNTVSIGQLKSETDDGLAVELKNYMANLEGGGSASVRVEKALRILKEKKKQLQKELLEEKRLEEEKKEGILTKVRFYKEELEKEQRELKNVILMYSHFENKGQDESKDLDKKSKRGFWARFWNGIKRFFAWLFKKNRKEICEMQEEEDSCVQAQKLQGKMEQLQQLIQDKEVLIENGYQEVQLMEEFCEETKVRKLTKEMESCNLAILRLEEVVFKLQVSIGQFLKQRTSEIFRELTDGRYQFVELKEDLTMLVHGLDRVVPVEQLSRGTIWQLYFALRMAANEVLCQEESLPVILDDAFAMYDEERLEKTLYWLSRNKKQVLLLTCHKREREILLRNRISFNEVELTR